MIEELNEILKEDIIYIDFNNCIENLSKMLKIYDKIVIGICISGENQDRYILIENDEIDKAKNILSNINTLISLNTEQILSIPNFGNSAFYYNPHKIRKIIMEIDVYRGIRNENNNELNFVEMEFNDFKQHNRYKEYKSIHILYKQYKEAMELMYFDLIKYGRNDLKYFENINLISNPTEIKYVKILNNSYYNENNAEGWGSIIYHGQFDEQYYGGFKNKEDLINKLNEVSNFIYVNERLGVNFNRVTSIDIVENDGTYFVEIWFNKEEVEDDYVNVKFNGWLELSKTRAKIIKRELNKILREYK